MIEHVIIASLALVVLYQWIRADIARDHVHALVSRLTEERDTALAGQDVLRGIAEDAQELTWRSLEARDNARRWLATTVRIARELRDERDYLRAADAEHEVERMRPVVDAAEIFRDTEGDAHAEAVMLDEAVDEYRKAKGTTP